MESTRNSVKKLLNTKTSPNTVHELKKLHNISLDSSSTNLDALNAIVLKKVREGDPEAIEAARKYGLMP